MGTEASATGVASLASGYQAKASSGFAQASGAGSNASGDYSQASGFEANATGMASIASGYQAKASSDLSLALGFQANASGSCSQASGFRAYASGSYSQAIGYKANASHTNSTAIGTNSATTRTDQLVLGSSTTEITVANLSGTGSRLVQANSDGTLSRVSTAELDEVTISGLSGSGTEMVGASSDGTLKRSSISMEEVETTVKTKVPKLESAARGLGQAVESSGAMASAMSAIPEVSLQQDEPMRCGIGTGGYGSHYAFSAGCAVRINDRLHLNRALAYTPSIDYQYGSTPSVAGRLGFSFPLGKISKASLNNDVVKVGYSEFKAYLSKIEGNIKALHSDVELRDDQINAFKARLDSLLNGSDNNQREGSTAVGLEATTQLIAMLKEQIKQLEEEKKASDTEDQKRDIEVASLKEEVLEQQDEISDLHDENQTLRKKMAAIMRKLGMK